MNEKYIFDISCNPITILNFLINIYNTCNTVNSQLIERFQLRFKNAYLMNKESDLKLKVKFFIKQRLMSCSVVYNIAYNIYIKWNCSLLISPKS